MFLGQASKVDLKAWRESAADVWSGMMFQKRIADGKKLLLWISVFGMGDEEFVHEAMGRVLGADGSFLSEFGVKQSTHLQICTVWWSCLKHNKISGRWVWACLHGRGIGGTSEVTANTECNSSLAPLQFVPQLLLMGVPYNALVELCLDYDVIFKGFGKQTHWSHSLWLWWYGLGIPSGGLLSTPHQGTWPSQLF